VGRKTSTEEDPDAEPGAETGTTLSDQHEAAALQKTGETGTGEEEESGTELGERREEESELAECQCTHCGQSVRPIPVKTRFGARSYRCPKCGKFFKPEGEATAEPGAEVALLKGREGEEEDEEALAPLEVEMTNRLKVLLTTALPRVWGIPRSDKRIQAITDTITPEQTSSPWNLHAHIKNFAPQADDRHLEAIITKIYSQLEAEGYIMESAATSKYQPRYARRGQRTRDGHYPSYGYGQQGRSGQDRSGYDEEEEFEGRPPKPLRAVIAGQTIETDAEGLIAWRRFQLEEAAAKRDEREHQLTMKKLEEEIKHIAKGSEEQKIPVKVGEQTINVPASLAPLYLNKGGESEDAKAFREKLTELEKQLAATEKKMNDKDKQDLRDQIAGLYSKIDELENRDPMAKIKEYEAYALEKGYTKGGRTTLDVISEGITNLDKRAQQLITARKGEEGEEFTPEVTRTPGERRAMAEDIQQNLEKKNKIIDAENRLLEAASNL
jgi:predicted RNA-binding Zn-ribbon protein involved in translation (DUF1610 family)